MTILMRSHLNKYIKKNWKYPVRVMGFCAGL